MKTILAFLFLLQIKAHADQGYRFSGKVTKEGDRFYISNQARALNPFRFVVVPKKGMVPGQLVTIETEEDPSLLSPNVVNHYKLISTVPGESDLRKGMAASTTFGKAYSRQRGSGAMRQKKSGR